MLDGIRAVFGGIGFIVTTPRIWPHAAVPMALLLLMACGLSALGIWGGNQLTNALLGENEGIWSKTGSWTLAVFLWIVALLVAMLVALLLAQPFSCFSLEAISLAQERALLGRETAVPSLLFSLLIALSVTVVTLIVGVTGYTLLFLVTILFPPAAIVTVPLKFLFGSCLLAWNFIDYPLSVRGMGVWRRLGWIFRNFEEFSVFGLTWGLLLFLIPGIFLLILPMGVAGATRLVLVVDGEYVPAPK